MNSDINTSTLSLKNFLIAYANPKEINELICDKLIDRLRFNRFVIRFTRGYLVVIFHSVHNRVIQQFPKPVRIQRTSPRLAKIIEETRNRVCPQPVHHVVEKVNVFSAQVCQVQIFDILWKVENAQINQYFASRVLVQPLPPPMIKK